MTTKTNDFIYPRSSTNLWEVRPTPENCFRLRWIGPNGDRFESWGHDPQCVETAEKRAKRMQAWRSQNHLGGWAEPEK